MLRLLVALLVGLAGSQRVDAADSKLAGVWKLRFAPDEQSITMLLNLSQTDGKWVGDFIGSIPALRQEPKISGLSVKGDELQFSMTVDSRELLSFDGALTKEGTSIRGTYVTGSNQTRLTELLPSKLKKLNDPAELAREDFAQLQSGLELYEAGFTLLEQAAAKKLPVEEVRGVADKLTKAASGYGNRWEREVALRLATTLAEQAGYSDVAIAQARRAERMLPDDAPVPVQFQVAETLGRAFAKIGKADEAKKYLGLAEKLQSKDYQDFVNAAVGFKPEAVKGKSAGRKVLVELFTAAETPPSVASADLAFDALVRTFEPSDVVFLKYHLPIQTPDPLICPDAVRRVQAYGEKVRTVPTVLVNGNVISIPRGVTIKEAYSTIRTEIEKAMGMTSSAKLDLVVTPKEKQFSVKAAVAELAQPGEKVLLRFFVIEDRVQYSGQNGVRYHRHVVRALPGNPVPLTAATSEQKVDVDPASIRSKQLEFLEESGFPASMRPLSLTNLKIVAVVQNETTGEVLQTAQAELK